MQNTMTTNYNSTFILANTILTTLMITRTSGCSSRPDIIDCSLSIGDQRSKVNNSVEWNTLRPFGLRSFYLLKTDPITFRLVPLSLIRWRLPNIIGVLPRSIEGFRVTVSSQDTGRQIRIFDTFLEKSVKNLTRDMTDVEFFIESEGIFEFGVKHSIEVALLPLGIGGVSAQIKQLPPAIKEDICERSSESAELAKFWSSSFASIHIMTSSSILNVSFLAAPKELCIDRYSVQVHSKHGGGAMVEKIVEAIKDPIQHCFFADISRGKEILVKVLPIASPDGYCPCTACNCITAKSETFMVPLIGRKEIFIPSHPVVDTSDSSRSSPFMIIFLILSTLFIILSILSILFLKHKREQILRGRTHRLYNCNAITPLIVKDDTMGKGSRLLVAVSPGSDRELCMVDDMVRLMSDAVTVLSVRYDRFEWNKMEENTYTWLLEAISNVDKIVLIYSRESPSGPPSPIFSMLSNALPFNDKRMIHLFLHPSLRPPFPSSLVPTYLLSRDLHLVCKSLNIDWNQQWMQLHDASFSLYSPLIASYTTSTINETQDDQTESIDTIDERDHIDQQPIDNPKDLPNSSRDSGFVESVHTG